VPAASSLLGQGFAIGVSTAGFQVEGGYNGDGQPHNNWLNWEHTGRVERSGTACDFWRHPEEALDRAASIGCTAFRLSVEWARLEPEPAHFDDAALARYVEILTLCAARGLEPFVALHHFTHPWWLGDEFWLRPASPERFLRHVQTVIPALVPHCRRWVTINEPHTLMWAGWVEGRFPPGRRLAVADAYCVLDNLLTAHVLAADAIVAVQPDAEVTCTTGSSSLYEHNRLSTDLLLLRSAGVAPADVDRYVDERRALHDAARPPRHAGELALRRASAAVCPYGTERGISGGALWAQVRRASRRPAPRRVVEAVHAVTQVRPLGALGFAWDDPRGLGAWCHAEAALHPGLPLWVEIGMATHVREHLGAVVKAVADGVPVQAYLLRSLVDAYEWGNYRPRRGLFGMDRTYQAGAVRWIDTDAQGGDAAGEFRRLVAGLVAGDRAVLNAPMP
jgi:hypothetical protein